MSFLRRLFSTDTAPSEPAPAASVVAHGELPVLDAAVQGELATVGGADLPAQLVTMFLGDAPNQLAGVRAAQAQGDLQAVRKLAHSMKGAAASIGASRVEAAARQLESAARSGEVAQVPSLTETLAEKLDELRTQGG